MDVRIIMIAIMALLLASGVWFRDFSLRPEQIALTFAFGLTTQILLQSLLTAHRRIGPRNILSAVITCFGISLLLRSDSNWVHPAAAVLAISAKFLIRVRGKHVFNPADFGVIASLILLPGVWVSPGQWGNEWATACWIVAAGSLLSRQARRWDISWAFLTFHLTLLAGRVMWLGQRPAVWFHQLGSGSLLLFAFFMISDPRTSPNHRGARILHAATVAVFAYFWKFVLYRQNDLLWALFLLGPLVPIWDRLWEAEPFQWEIRRSSVIVPR